MIVAVTGASGFIGSHLTAELAARGHSVRALARRAGERRGNGVRKSDADPTVESVTVDYSDDSALERAFADVDIVFHAAGATRAPTRRELEVANVELTQRVFGAFHRATESVQRRFVLVSSQAAAGPAAALDSPIHETDHPAPIEAYGQTKLAAEQAIESADTRDCTWTVIRPAAVYGPRDRDFLQLFRLARWGMAVHPANREHWISIVHVRDLVDGMIAAATTPCAAGRAYYFANDEPVQWRELFRLGAAAAGRSLTIDVEVPRTIVELGARVGDVVSRATGTATLLASEKLALSRPVYWLCSSERAKRDLGFRAATPLADGFATTYDWYAQHGWL
jgi:nucleoside-diphosphate-sugar epimerase